MLTRMLFIPLAILIVIILGFTVFHFKRDTDIVKHALTKQKEFKVQSNYILYIDLDKPVFLPRLYLIDKSIHKVIKRDFVFTSYKSGFIYANKFSNTPNSNITSKGAFMVLNDYTGRFGYSARIKGLEPSNNNVTNRAIVIHPWVGVPSTFGCYSTTEKTLNKILPLIKNGSFMYVNKTE